jgi:hypothetical protein
VFAGLVGLGAMSGDPFGALTSTFARIAGVFAGDRANIQPAVSALFVVGVGKGGALSAGIDRLWETAIGAAVAIVVAQLGQFRADLADV